MQTTFILNGGFNPENTDTDRSPFYKEIMKHAPGTAKILLVPFAKDDDRIPASIEKLTKEFESAKSDKNITVDVANEHDLIEKIKFADVIYFPGGSSLKLLDALKKYPDLKDSLDGKVVAGESAGANVWCTYFYSPRADKVSAGLGFLPYKMIPHFKEEYEHAFEGIAPELEDVFLLEYEFRIFSN